MISWSSSCFISYMKFSKTWFLKLKVFVPGYGRFLQCLSHCSCFSLIGAKSKICNIPAQYLVWFHDLQFLDSCAHSPELHMSVRWYKGIDMVLCTLEVVSAQFKITFPSHPNQFFSYSFKRKNQGLFDACELSGSCETLSLNTSIIVYVTMQSFLDSLSYFLFRSLKSLTS